LDKNELLNAFGNEDFKDSMGSSTQTLSSQEEFLEDVIKKVNSTIITFVRVYFNYLTCYISS
jgi:hypothetical protein